MKLHLRRPYDEEWQLCCMLLPETFADAGSRDYLLCLRDEEPRLVAAVSFRRAGDEAKKLRIHVVPAFRRVEQLFTVEADLAEMRQYLHRLRDRIGVPAGARVIRLPDAPFETVARLHAAEIAHSELNPWRALLGQSRGLALSPVAMVDDEVAGFMLWEVQGTTPVVHSRVSAPAYRGGWITIVLLSDALDTGWNAGYRTTRFSYLESNRRMKKLVQRFHARTVSVVTHFRHEARA